MAEILVCEEHSQVYDAWVARKLSGLHLTHIDFHCDMRGLLLDRRRSRAYFIDGTDANVDIADSGNFIAHAIANGIVTSLRWVHDEHGGRKYDSGTVKYESDLSALPHRIRHKLRGNEDFPVNYEEMTFDQWDGAVDGDHLDIDWDGIASIDYELSHIRSLMDRFLDCNLSRIPETTYLAYSPGYSHPDRTVFEEFIERLASKFSADVVRLPQPKLRPGYPTPPQALSSAQSLKYQFVLKLHRLGIY